MAWKKLTFILIPHSQDTVKQVSVPRSLVYGTIAFLCLATVVMIYYIIGFEGKEFYRNLTSDLETRNDVLNEHLALFDSSLAEMEVEIAELESVNVDILEVAGISERDLQVITGETVIPEMDGLSLPPQAILTLINRMERESFAFELNYSSLLDVCAQNEDYVKRLPSIRPASGYISREFGPSFDKYSKTEKTHPGVDIHNIEGTPVVATADGVVADVYFSNELGQCIEINHLNGYRTRYAHLQAPNQMDEPVDIEEGDTVTRGQVIGAMGRTGISLTVESARLMYSVFHHGITVDPADYFFASNFTPGDGDMLAQRIE